MARWTPQDKVGLNEAIGRRLFDEPMLQGTVGQPDYSGIKLYHFEEKRGNEVSVDRLGATGIEKKVVSYLRPRAEADGKKTYKPRSFDGWMVVKTKELVEARKPPRLQVVSSPIRNPEPEDNEYHAHIVLPETDQPQLLALHIRHIFVTYGKLERNDSHPTVPPKHAEYLTKVGRVLSGFLKSIGIHVRGN